MRNISLKNIVVLLFFVVGLLLLIPFTAYNLFDFDEALLIMSMVSISWGISALIASLADKRKIVRLPFTVGLISLGVPWLALILTFVTGISENLIRILFFLSPIGFAVSLLSYLFLRKRE